MRMPFVYLLFVRARRVPGIDHVPPKMIQAGSVSREGASTGLRWNSFLGGQLGMALAHHDDAGFDVGLGLHDSNSPFDEFRLAAVRRLFLGAAGFTARQSRAKVCGHLHGLISFPFSWRSSLHNDGRIRRRKSITDLAIERNFFGPRSRSCRHI